MYPLGRIITKLKNIETFSFIDITNENIIDSTVPTLIIGKERAIELCGKDNIHVLNKQIKNNLWWTYSKTDNRNEYEKSIKKYNETILHILNKTVKYQYIDIFNITFNNLKRFIMYINSDIKKVIFFNGKDMYIYSGKNIIGLSLRDCEYIGIDCKKIYNKIKLNKSNIILKNISFMSRIDKKILKESKILIPYLYFLTIK